MKRTGFSPSLRRPYGTVISPVPSAPLGELSEDCDDKLFFSARYNPNHVFHRLLPQPKNTQYHLRQRKHGLILPTDVNAASKKNFLYRMLFSDMY